MANNSAIIASVELEKIKKSMKGLANIALTKTALDLISAFDDNTQVDKGTMRAEWDYKMEKPDMGAFAQVSVFNRMPYAGVVDLGSPAGEIPWPSQGPKTMELDGRIWSSQAVLGVTAPVLGDEGGYMDKMMDNIQKFVLGGL
jgi:hypothetical protein